MPVEFYVYLLDKVINEQDRQLLLNDDELIVVMLQNVIQWKHNIDHFHLYLYDNDIFDHRIEGL